MIRLAQTNDANELSEIYNYYIENSVATFDETTIAPQDMLNQVKQILDSDHLPWLVSLDPNQRITGYAYASPWKTRSAYRFTTEITAYLSPDATGHGLGSRLYDALFADLKERSIVNVLACISLPNPESIALHEKFGLTKVAHFSKVGIKFDKWIDVGYWQGTL